MTSVSSINASPAFHKYFDPVTHLKKNLEFALEHDGLEIWFMGSRPPTREECEMGYQWLVQDDLPAQRGGVTQKPKLGGYGHDESQYLPVVGVHRLNHGDWAELRDALPSLKGELLSLIPKTVLEGGAVSLTLGMVDDPAYRTTGVYGLQAAAPWYPRWALLMARGTARPTARTWCLTNDQRWGVSLTEQLNTTEKVLFDFRGGIPLSIGTRESSANLRIGHLGRQDRAWREHFKGRSGWNWYTGHIEWYSTVQAFGLHIPLPPSLVVAPSEGSSHE